jgi:hypothetical protein
MRKAMPEWNLEPERLACMILQTYPHEAEEVVLDFLEHATNRNNHEQTVFWIIVHNIVEHMQAVMSDEPDYVPELSFGAVM